MMLQRLSHWFWRGGLWGVLLLLFLSALYLSAGRILTPMLNAYRVEVQQWLGEQLGQPLHLGRLYAGWHGLSPRFYAEDVRLGGTEQTFQVDRLHFRPDMLASLLRRDWSLAAISLQGVEIELQQQAGHWQLNGMSLAAAPGEKPADWNNLLAQLQRVGHLSLVDVRLLVRQQGAAPVEFPQAGLTLEHSGGRTRVQARIQLPDGQLLELAGQARIEPKQWQQSDLDVYVNLPGSNWLQWLAPDWLTALPEGMRLEQASLAAQGWLQVRKGHLQALSLEAGGGRLKGHWQGDAVDVQLGQVRAGFSQDAQQRRLWLPELNVRWLPREPMQNLALQLRQNAGEPLLTAATSIYIPRLQLEPLMAGLLQHIPLPQLPRSILEQLDFRGGLRNTYLRWQPGLPWQQQLEYDTNIDGLDYSPWENVPGATGISGRLFGSLAGGELHLDSAGFSLYLRELFADPWYYHRARARLTWELTESFDFTLSSPYLQVRGDEGRLAGDFVIRLPGQSGRESYMDLRVGMRDGDASHKSRYLPLVLRDEQPELWSWLREAVIGADIHQGYFQYQGTLAAGAPPAARSISLFFDVSDARLAYQPGWPELEEARAQVYVHDQGVEIDIERGRILQTGISDVHAEVIYPRAGASRLQVDARLASSMKDALQVVQETPMVEQLPFMAAWQGQGDLNGRLQLEVPFAEHQQPRVQLDLQLANNSLHMPELDLRFEQLQGALHIDSQRGMSGSAVAGRVLEQPFTASLRLPASGARWGSQIRARGKMPVARLQSWLGHAEPLPFSGAFAYQLDLLLAEQGSQLAVNTDLQGVRIDLPAPLGKSAAEKISTSWHMTLDGNEQHYRLVHGTRLSGLFATAQQKDGPLRGQLVLGGQVARLPARDGIWIAGRLPRLQVPDWLDAIGRYGPAARGPGTAVAVQEVQLSAGRLEGLGIPLEQAQLRVRPEGTGWQVRLDSAQASGRLHVPASGSMMVSLDRLQLPTGDDSLLSSAGGLQPANVPAMQVRVNRLLLGDELLGSAGFASRTDAAGDAWFEDISADLKGLQIAGSLQWHGGQEQRSRFQGALSGARLEQVLQAWGYAESMSSERFNVELDLGWPGAPQAFALEQLDGVAQLKFRKGQLKAADGSAQVLRVFGLLNFDSIGRRLRLDFSDLWGKGLSYDRIDGAMDIKGGVFRTRDELVLEGVSSNLSVQGVLDVPAGTIDADLQVAMPISRNLPLAAVAAGAPAIGGALFVIDRLVGDRFSRMAAARYSITGDWQNPDISLARGGREK